MVSSNGIMKNILLGSAAVLLSAVLCAALIRGYKSAVPEDTGKDIINITNSQYESALAKWRSHAVSEYEITISRPSEQYKLRVNDVERTVYVLEHTADGLKQEVRGLTAPVSYDSYRDDWTIEGLFSTTKDALESFAGGTPLLESSDTVSYAYEYNIEFDSSLGYPKHIHESQRRTLSLKEITWRFEQPKSATVKDLRVIE